MFRRSLPFALLLSSLVLADTGPAAARASWSDARTPSAGPARVIGGPAGGCIAGAQRLPTDGPGFQAIRVSRNRHFGHPDTVAFIERLGKRAAASGLTPFYVGDMSQPRGGPMAFGHGSHQNGLDVVILGGRLDELQVARCPDFWVDVASILTHHHGG